MCDLNPDLFEKEWNAWTERSGASAAAAQRWLADLAGRYAEPQRHYHGRSHIVDLLKKFTPLAEQFELQEEAMAALYFHDAIYEIGKPDNESLSAELARQALPELGFPTDATARVATIVEATASHAVTGDADTDLFIDLDMSILSEARETYASYASSIMAEFTTVYSKADYVVGRTSMFLEPSLKRERLFLTNRYFADESAARENMVWEIGWLRGGL